MPNSVEELIQEGEEQSKILSSQAPTDAMAISTADMVSAGIELDRMQAGFALTEFLKEAQAVSISNLQTAIVQGYEHMMEGRAELATNLDVEFDLDEDEEQSLYKYPVFGHTLDEVAIHLTRNIEFVLQSVLAKLSSGAITPQQLPKQIDDAQRAFARQLGSAVINFYLGGSQAASEQFRRGINAIANQ